MLICLNKLCNLQQSQNINFPNYLVCTCTTFCPELCLAIFIPRLPSILTTNRPQAYYIKTEDLTIILKAIASYYFSAHLLTLQSLCTDCLLIWQIERHPACLTHKEVGLLGNKIHHLLYVSSLTLLKTAANGRKLTIPHKKKKPYGFGSLEIDWITKG